MMMSLVYLKSQEVAQIDLEKHTLSIFPPSLRTEMKERGIRVPDNLSNKYQKQSVIKLGQDLFAQLFHDHYVNHVLNKNEVKYEWIPSDRVDELLKNNETKNELFASKRKA